MSHIYHELYYHLIWSTKKRQAIINEDLEKMIKRFLDVKVKELNGELLEFNTADNHCHLLVKIIPQISVSEFVGKLKGYSSHEVNQIKGPGFLKWQQGFGVLSLSRKGAPFVKKYIQVQKEHHKNNSTLDILERLPEVEDIN